MNDILLFELEKNYSSHKIGTYEYNLKQFLSFLEDHTCSTELCYYQSPSLPVYLAPTRKRQTTATIHQSENFLFKIFHQILDTNGIEIPYT
ncbi:hypothetical protein CWO92_07925 [Heyndrickxia camelliae]|uniref:Core-binding (CB) domain-containing protein n=1 Tax=Heyndrickxia camelliae TaxID=1707093 RepID=A0A2N3LM57_9BACI|nr:hypothetical protein CWO92_07925 [Heyndrickxia camelliae]